MHRTSIIRHKRTDRLKMYKSSLNTAEQNILGKFTTYLTKLNCYLYYKVFFVTVGKESCFGLEYEWRQRTVKIEEKPALTTNTNTSGILF